MQRRQVKTACDAQAHVARISEWIGCQEASNPLRYCIEAQFEAGRNRVNLTADHRSADGQYARIRALNDEFKNTMAFGIGWGNVVLVASDAPLDLDLAAIDNAFRQPVIAEELQDVGVPDVAAVIGNVVGTPEGLRKLTASASPNVDDTNKTGICGGEQL